MTQRYEKGINKAVVTEFQKRHAVITRLAITMGIVVGIVSMLAYFDIASKMAAVFMLVVAFAYGTIVNVKKWRCPSCNGHLGKLYLGLKEPKHCPCCGIKLIEE